MTSGGPQKITVFQMREKVEGPGALLINGFFDIAGFYNYPRKLEPPNAAYSELYLLQAVY